MTSLSLWHPTDMKLYDVPKNTRIRLTHEGEVYEYLFHRLDGMYSYCTDDDGNVLHLAAWTEVEIAE
jgi:hypothetical protein